ncbi:MAG: hypothetical protein MMC33_000996 [Icmadophila ericetorum]|nr:hypothetical protein [Icmadophila ericetorum]
MDAPDTRVTKPRIIIHGGAGNITREKLPPQAYRQYWTFLMSTLRVVNNMLTVNGASALDAATYAVEQLETNPLFNCGKGAVFTRVGTIELEASVMVSRGYRKRGVGVSLLKRVKSPIKLAREMLIRGETDGNPNGGNNGGDSGDPAGGSGGAQGHCFLSGETVEGLAKEWGLEMVDEKYFWTKKRWEEHKAGLGKEGENIPDWDEMGKKDGSGWLENKDGETDGDIDWNGHDYLPQGTVGCVCLDQTGTLCVATSTGGLTNKLPGRIGDTPTLGAGFWAEEWPVSAQRRTQAPTLYTHPTLPNLATFLPPHLLQSIASCLPWTHFQPPIQLPLTSEKPSASSPFSSSPKPPSIYTHACAMSGTGNGDSFLRLSAVRTAAAITRFSPDPHDRTALTLASSVQKIAGPGGELQASAGDRWGVTGEGEGGIIGIEYSGGINGVGAKSDVVWNFNCGGMWRAWVDEKGQERCMVFREEYQV